MTTWLCDTFLVFWEIVEPHLPSRVMRQFGYQQPIPTNLLMDKVLFKRLHKMKKKGSEFNWEGAHQIYIQHWNSRNQHFVTGLLAESFESSVEYMNWYWPRTVAHIAPPNVSQNIGFPDIAPSHMVMVEGFTYLHNEFENRWPGHELSHVPQHYMDQANVSHRMSMNNMYYSQNDGSWPGPPPPSAQTIRRSPNRRGRDMGCESSRHVAEPSTSYRPPGPSTYDIGGSSAQQERRQRVPDLNVDPLEAQPPPVYYTPQPPPNVGHDTEYYTPIPPPVPTEDMYGGPSRGNMSPVSLDFDANWSWSELYNAMNSGGQDLQQTPSREVSIPTEDDLRNWELIPNRERRQPRPRGPCITSERYNRHHSDHSGHS